MTVRADSENLDIDIRLIQDVIEFPQVRLYIAGPFCYISIVFVNIYVVKQVTVHEITVTLIMRSVKSDIFIQVNAVHLAEIKAFFSAATGQFPIHANRAASCGKSKRAFGIVTDDPFNNICSLFSTVLIVFRDNNLHEFFLRSMYLISAFQRSLVLWGDRPVVFPDTLFRYGPADAGCGVDIGITSDHCARIQHAVASDFNSVTEHSPDLFEACFNSLIAAFHNDQKLVAFHV